MDPMPLGQLLEPRQFRVHTPKRLIARALWEYGEDELARRALGMSEDERLQIDKISAWYEMPDYPLPMSGQRITHHHVAAFMSQRSRLCSCSRALQDRSLALGVGPRRRPSHLRPVALVLGPPEVQTSAPAAIRALMADERVTAWRRQDDEAS
jgi:hypothetical protein